MRAITRRPMASLGRWGSTVGWWAVESIRILTWRGALGAALGLVGPILQIAALLLVLGYASWLTTNESRAYLGMEWIPRESRSLLAAIAVFTATMLVLAAVARWSGAILILKCRLRIEKAVGERVLELAEVDYALSGQGEESGLLRPSDVLKLARRDGRAAGRVVVSLYMAIPAVVLLLAAVVALMWIATWLTLLLLAALGASSLLLAAIGRRAASASRRLEEVTPAATAAIKRNLGRPESSSVFGQEAVRSAANAYFGRLRGTPDSHFVSDLSLALLVATILVVLGPDGSDGDQGWERLVGFLIGLRVLQSSLRQLVGRLAGVNRFYPQLHRLRRALLRKPGTGVDHGTGNWEIVARDVKGPCVNLSPGSRLAVVLPIAWSPLVVGAIARGLASGPGRARRLLASMVVASDDVDEAVERARAAGRWIVVLPESVLDSGRGRDALPVHSDLAYLIVYRQPEAGPPRFGESAVLAVDLVPEFGPLAVVSDGADIDRAALTASQDLAGEDATGEIAVAEEDEDDF